MGRPKLPKEKRREKEIKIRMNPAELKALDKARRFKTRSEYIRGLVDQEANANKTSP